MTPDRGQRRRDRARGRRGDGDRRAGQRRRPDDGPIAIDTVTQPSQRHRGHHRRRHRAHLPTRPELLQRQAGDTPDTFTYTLNRRLDRHRVGDGHLRQRRPDRGQRHRDGGRGRRRHGGDVLANDTDATADPIGSRSVTQPTNGTVAITGGGAGLTYQPNPTTATTRPAPPRTRSPTRSTVVTTATVSVTVTCVDDPPVAVDDAVTRVEDAARPRWTYWRTTRSRRWPELTAITQPKTAPS